MIFASIEVVYLNIFYKSLFDQLPVVLLAKRAQTIGIRETFVATPLFWLLLLMQLRNYQTDYII